VDAGEEVGGELIVASGKPSEVLETAEHALDRISALVQIRTKAALPLASYLGRDVGRGLLGFDELPHYVCVVGPVGEDDAPLRQSDEQRLGGFTICSLAWRQQEGERAALAVGESVQLGVSPAA
jgi:hypothetical protein